MDYLERGIAIAKLMFMDGINNLAYRERSIAYNATICEIE